MISESVAPIHLAAQYLAAAGISFLEKKEDDSHTNLGYSAEHGQLFTRPLNDRGGQMVLDLNNFSLKWRSDNSNEAFELDAHTHNEILAWIGLITEKEGFDKPFKYQFHYELPYEIYNDYVFVVGSEVLSRERHLRTISHSALTMVLAAHDLDSEIRIWPHHFDTGAFAQLRGSNGISVGMGLAIPDSVHDGYYFYLSGYNGHEPIDTKSFDPLTRGVWSHIDFTGAILAAEDVDQDEAILFFNEAINAFRN